MIVIPPGTFTMGVPVRESGDRDGHASPPHEVQIGYSFAIGMYPVTRGEYAAFARETNPSADTGCNYFDGKQWATDPKKNWQEPGFPQTDRDPVVCVSWDEAQAYARWLDAKARGSNRAAASDASLYRLPSEAEWEYVARAGTSTFFYWGPRASHEYANYGLEHCLPCGVAQEGRDRWDYTSPVGSFPPNAFGVYDALGNVWQWTEDCLGVKPGVTLPNGERPDSYEGAPTDGSPSKSGDCRAHYLRGGSWLDPARYVQVEERNPWPRGDHNNANGFRVARRIE